jgi:Tol biopolymer transport system component
MAATGRISRPRPSLYRPTARPSHSSPARAGEPPRIWIRPLGEDTARELPGTDAAISMFWSPDGRSLAFFISGQLKRLDLSGSAAVKICDVPIKIGLSGSWGPDGDILFSTVQGDRISRVSAAGGAPVDVIVRSPTGGERLLWPRHVPRSRRFVYLSLTPDLLGRIMLVDADGTSRPIVDATSQPQWIDPDWLVFVREGTLVAQRMDLTAGRPVGEPVSILGTVTYSAATGWANFAASPNGTLVVQWVLDESRVAWFDASGKEIGQVGAPGAYATLRLSPDDSTLLFTRVRPELGTRDIWSTDLAPPSEKRVTSSPGMEVGEVWLPGARAIVYGAGQGGPPNLHYKDLATGAERRLLTVPRFQYPSDVSLDGTQIVYEQRTTLGNFDLMLVSIADSSNVTPLLTSDADESEARVAPRGGLMSFTSDESGRRQVYVTSFPTVGERKAVSTSGGFAARWRRDGRELYFISTSGQLMAAPISDGGVPGTPRALFPAKGWLDYDVAGNGRFIAVVSQRVTGEQPLAVILNWSRPDGVK